MSISAPTKWLPFNQAIKTINFPNPLQAAQAALWDGTRSITHLAVGFNLMDLSRHADVLGEKGDSFVKQAWSLWNPLHFPNLARPDAVAEGVTANFDKLGDGLHHLAVYHLDKPLLLTGLATALIGLGFGLRGQSRHIAQSDKLSKQGAVSVISELLPQKAKALLSKAL